VDKQITDLITKVFGDHDSAKQALTKYRAIVDRAKKEYYTAVGKTAKTLLAFHANLTEMLVRQNLAPEFMDAVRSFIDEHWPEGEPMSDYSLVFFDRKDSSKDSWSVGVHMVTYKEDGNWKNNFFFLKIPMKEFLEAVDNCKTAKDLEKYAYVRRYSC
jgi:hypothetical protein